MHRDGNGLVKPGKEDLRLYLARRHKKRAKKGMRKGERIFKPNWQSIDDRPLVVNLRSWERGTNENTNGLVRRYFPKGTVFADVSEEEIARVEYALNTRPRKQLGYRTPLEV